MTIVSIKKMSYSKPDIRGLLEPLGGMKKFIRKGDEVLLKVNLLAAAEPKKAVTTRPEFVRAVAELVKECGGKPYIGDSPGGPFNKLWVNRAYKKCGFQKLSEEADIPLNFDWGHQMVEVKDAKVYKKVKLGSYVTRADKIIELPKPKTHSYQYYTGAVKITYGHIPGMTKGKLHTLFRERDDFADMLLDIYLARKPDLYIMDAVVAMEGQGPHRGDPVKMGLALASVDPVAVDLAIAEMINVRPEMIPVLKMAKVRGMWPEELEYPLERPKDHIHKDFKMASTAEHLRTGRKPSARKPVVDEDLCIGCGRCETICASGAIKVNRDVHKALVDYKKCIRCYCCHEICPEGAIDVK